MCRQSLVPNMQAKYEFAVQVVRPGAWKLGPALMLVQVTPPLVERYMTFWRVVRPPPPSFIEAT
ncbi:MAG: hypothetical protein DME94_11525 [Verrucomicrobia bacterium]|nr:MAG: hypothetical protein DME94_11525 [Verrucomicrobiota bacterium]